MAKRRQGQRPTKLHHAPWLLGIGLVGYFWLVPAYGLFVYVLLAFCVFMLWFLFLMPTRCDFEVDGRGCRRRVNGKVNGCYDHGRDKRDAISPRCVHGTQVRYFV